MTHDADSLIVHKTGSSTNQKQYTDGCEYIHPVVNGYQLTIYHAVGASQKICDQFIIARIRKPPWSMKAFVRTVCKIEHHDVVCARIFKNDFRDQHPQEWTKQDLITLMEATEVYMVEVIAASHCVKR
jgi:hypothetical protein